MRTTTKAATIAADVARHLLTMLFIMFLAGAFTTSAQERFGELNGTATDATGAVLPNVNVTIKENDTQRTYTTTTTSSGAYVVRNLEPGHYTVTFETQGFARYQAPNVNITAGRVLTLNPQLAVGSTEQSVQITEAAPAIDVTTTAVSTNISSGEFENLPKSRTFQSLAILTPTANEGIVEGGIQINGASSAENQFIVDGISTNSLMNGHSRQNTAFEILQEVQVKTGGIEAQYGGALGGVISAITRSGGNNFHGDVHYYFYGSPLNAGPVKRLLMDPIDIKTVTYQQDYKNPSHTHEPGYSLGGPILKNRLYFFSAASPQFSNREFTYITADNQTVKLTEDRKFWQAYNKVNWDIFHNLRANAAFLWTPGSQDGVLPAYNSYGNRTTQTAASLLPNQNRGSFSPQSNYNASIDWTVTPTTLVQVRASRFWDNYKALGVPNVSAIEWGVPSIGLPFAIPANLQQAQLYTTTPRVRATQYDLATRTWFQADVSKFVNFLGGHDIKVGVGRMKNVNKVLEGYPGGGYITLYWDRTFEAPNGTTDRGTYGYYQLDNEGTQGSTGGTIDNFYVQDRWRIGRLSLDLGVRLEKEVVPSFRRDLKEFAFEFGWGQKVAPRLGASFDVFGDGRMKVYGSWGLFYDWVKYELARGTFGGDVWQTSYRSLDTLDVLSLSGTNLPGRNLWPGGGVQDHRIPSFGSNQVDPDLNPMSTSLTNAGVEFRLGPSTVVAARYTRNSLRDTIEDLGVLVEGSEVYIYGNPGRGLAETAHPTATATPSFTYPRPVRNYNALEFSVARRFSNRWQGQASYVYSRLRGNYPGLANSDEIFPTATGFVSGGWTQQLTGSPTRPGTSASRAWDLETLLFDAHGNFDPQGPLQTDRPHSFKAFGSYLMPWGTEIGGFFLAQSGTPVSTWVMDINQIPLFVNGRGDLGRTPVWNRTDLIIAQEFKIREGQRFRIEFNAENLFNQKTSAYTYNYLNRFRTRGSLINLGNVNMYNGYDYNALIAGTPDARLATGALDPRFGFADNFRTGFIGRIGLKYMW